MQKRFKIDWVLVDELAIGPAPLANRHVLRLQDAGIKVILSLCEKDEVQPPSSMQELFPCHRYVLPDHRSGRLPKPSELKEALSLLAELYKKHGSVYVHCVAAMERSPLVCMAWLVQRHRLRPEQALDYLMQVHPGTNPLPGQLALLHHSILNSPPAGEA
jgi:protein-tyrosine phosphatase